MIGRISTRKHCEGPEAATAVWRHAQERLAKIVNAAVFQQWFAGLVPLRIEAPHKLILGVPDDYFGEWLSRLGDQIEKALQDVRGADYTFALENGHELLTTTAHAAARAAASKKPAAPAVSATPAVSAPSPAAPAVSTVSAAPAAPAPAKRTLKSAIPAAAARIPAVPAPSPAAPVTPAAADGVRPARSRMVERFTFENFVVGEENRYAYTAACAVAEQPGLPGANPLYIYGNTGLGKTHLLHAIAHRVMANNPSAVVRYAPCEEVLNDFVDSLRSHNYNDFRARLREVDVLLVDDIHLLGKKGELQEQFFNAFNVLYGEGRQIVLASDKRPSEIAGLEARLISRFEMGITQELAAPGFEIRLAVLRSMQEEQLVRFDDEVLEFIASRISSNVRRLRGALMKLVLRALVDRDSKVTVEYAERILHDVLEEEHIAKLVTVEDVLKKVSEHFNLGLSELLSAKKSRNVAEPRMVAMYLARKFTSQSFPQLGTAFGRNHATIISACSKIPELCRKDEAMRRAVSHIERQLEAE